jgi:hypothetical protein
MPKKYENGFIHSAINKCISALEHGVELPIALSASYRDTLIKSCEKKGIEPHGFLESQEEYAPGKILNDFIKLGFGNKEQKAFRDKYAIVIELENGLAQMEHIYGEGIRRFTSSLHGRPIAERERILMGFPGVSEGMLKFVRMSKALEKFRQEIATTRWNYILANYMKDFEKTGQGIKSAQELWQKIRKEEKLTPKQKQEITRLENKAKQMQKDVYAARRHTDVNFQEEIRKELMRKSMVFEKLRATQTDSALKKRQKRFFERGMEAMKNQQSHRR